MLVEWSCEVVVDRIIGLVVLMAVDRSSARRWRDCGNVDKFRRRVVSAAARR